ncbi:HK97 family phage prohead protease [Glaciimonas sp. GNP009]
MERKSLALANAQFKLDDDNTFVGYASTFGNVDSYGDTIIKGAYAATLQEHGLPKMFFNHDSYAVPIGKWVKASEDDYGLLLTGEFTPGNTLAQEVRAALKHGTVDSMSIGYRLKKGDYEDTPSGRTIKKVARLAETSIVTFPADKFARVDLTSVKSFVEEINQVDTIRDFEYLLRDAGGFSKGAAQALTARAKTLFGSRDAVDQVDAKHAAEILERLRKIAA